jgi:hypothetical protein
MNSKYQQTSGLKLILIALGRLEDKVSFTNYGRLDKRAIQK